MVGRSKERTLDSVQFLKLGLPSSVGNAGGKVIDLDSHCLYVAVVSGPMLTGMDP